MSSDGEASKPEKRRPGRPPTKKPKPAIQRLGIANTPSNEGAPAGSVYAIELHYDNPLMFKKITGLFKTYDVAQIEVFFDHDKMILYAPDHHGNVTIFAEIFGNMMNRYYVSAPLRICIDTQRFYNIFQGIGKEYNQISFITNNKNKKTKLWMVFKREDHNSNYGMELNINNDESGTKMSKITEFLQESENYPISFELPFKELKSKITELNHISKKIRITQKKLITRNNGETETQVRIAFECDTPDKKIDNTSFYTNSRKINLKSTYDGDYFTAPIWINQIRPLANTLMSDRIIIQVDERKDLILSCVLDLDEGDKKSIPNTEKCHIRVISKLAFSENNPNL